MGKSSDLPALPRQVPGNAPRDPVARRPLVPALVWIGLMLLTLPLTGCRSFSPAYAAYLAGTLGIVAGSLLFLDAIYRKGASRPFAAFRKFTGYSVVAFYILHSLPRVEWSNAHSIGEGRAVFLYALTLACTAAGIALHTVMGRKPVLVTFGVMSAEEARDPALLKKNRKARGKGLVGSTLEWVDVFAYAVIAVLLVQTFVFQLFVVPSESMVPVFLGGDRPFTASLIAGPHLPLTMWRLPFLKQPARGDVVMLTNPRYAENHDVNLKRYLAQALYKVTFTLVNIDRTTASGEEKADPLVKRIVGVPGEKLMMVDDVLYARSAADAEFRPVAEDAARYSQVDLWKLPEGIRTRVKTLPIDSRIRDVLAKWDARKNAADPAVLAAGLADSWSRLEKRLAGLPSSVLSAFERTELPGANPAIASLRNEAEKAAPAGAENAFSISGITTEDLSTALALCH
jgi:signal peptidase I